MAQKNEVRHTPGPWVATKQHKSSPARMVWGVTKDTVTGIPLGIATDCDEADARLIAAAPELLEVCQVTNKVLHNFIEYCNEAGKPVTKPIQTAYLMTGDAIAKAEGGSL